MGDLWQWISTNPAQCLFVVLLAGSVVAAVYYLFTRFRTVPEGHVAIIQRLDKFERTAGPGLYMLRPMEEEVARLYVRQREARAVVPNVFTEGGLPVTVNLRYSYTLDPKYMNRDEVYYTDEARDEQLRTLLKRVFQDLMYQLEQLPAPTNHGPAKGDDPDRVNVERLFSPFAGRKARTVQTALEPAVREALRPHGIIVTNAPVLINGLTLPPEISGAYVDLLSADFDSSARADFIRRVRKAAPNMTEGGLVQLLNIIQNPSASIQSVFSGGTLTTEVLLEGSQSSTRHTIQPGAKTPSASQASTAAVESGVPARPVQAGPPHETNQRAPTEPQLRVDKPPVAAFIPAGSSADTGMDPDYPLTEEDNELLKTTRTEIA
jgi:regulator of protease activity HflC (stomatin/prohibitin superfamily)